MIWFDSDNYSLWEAKKATSIYFNEEYFISFYVKGKSPYKRAPGHYLQKKPIPKGMPVITCVYVEDFNKESFIEALEKRRNYVATDWIVLDFTVEGHPMGDKFLASNPNPRMLARIIGTGEIEQVDIIRNAKCIYSSKNIRGKEADITFVDMDISEKDDYHYFIQIRQKEYTKNSCNACHLQPGLFGSIKATAYGLKNIYTYFFGIEEDDIKASRPINCTRIGCHTKMEESMFGKRIRVNHGLHMDMRYSCVVCHDRVAHEKYSMAKDLQR